MKKRISFFLCIVFLSCITFFAIPLRTLASSNVYLYPHQGQDGGEYTTYRGLKNLYAGDFVSVFQDPDYNKPMGKLSMQKGVSYKSSKTSVADINSKTGEIITKKNGTTKITAIYKGQKTYFYLKVEDKKKVEKEIGREIRDELTERRDCAKAFFRTTGKVTNIDKANRYKILTAYKSYVPLGDNWTAYDGVDRDFIYSPEEAHILAVCSSLGLYADKRSPFLAKSSQCFKIKSIEGKSNSKKISVKLEKNVEEDQIFAGLYALSGDSDIKRTDQYSFPISVQDTKTNYKYYAIATVKKGTNKITIETKNLKLRKGKKYKLVAQYGTWLDEMVNKNTFKVY